jgi:polysaccharide biosynthesis protein PslJ
MTTLRPRSKSSVAGLRPIRPRVPWDAVTVLTAYILLMYAIPSDRRISALGTAGSVSVVFALGATLWWCWHQLRRSEPTPMGPQPVRNAQFVLMAAVFASYIAAALRPLPAAESTTVDSSLLRMLAWSGILLVTSDGIPSFARLLTVLRRLSWAAALLAALGLVQFFTHRALVDMIQIPGLTPGAMDLGSGSRGGFARVVGTAVHPLEYAAVLSTIFPVALSLAIYDRARRPWQRFVPVSVIALSLLLSVSRSAILVVAIGLVVLVPSWSRAIRRRALVTGIIMLGAVYLFVPGMIGTVTGLFTGLSEDSSTVSRTDSYDLAGIFISRSPWFGRGFGTFLPDYRILDNQYLQSTIELGIFGLVALLSLPITAAVCGFVARRRLENPLLRAIGQSLTAAALSEGVLTGLFDTFSFPQAVGTSFLILGLAGAYWRLASLERGTAEMAAHGASKGQTVV